MIEELLQSKARRKAATPSVEAEPPESSARVREDLENIRSNFVEHESYLAWQRHESTLSATRQKLAAVQAEAKAATLAVPAALEAGDDPSELELQARAKTLEGEQLAARLPVLESLAAKAKDAAAQALRDLVRDRLRAAGDRAQAAAQAAAARIEELSAPLQQEIARAERIMSLANLAFWEMDPNNALAMRGGAEHPLAGYEALP